MCQMVSDMMRQVGQYQCLVAILSLIEKCKLKIYTNEFVDCRLKVDRKLKHFSIMEIITPTCVRDGAQN